MNDRERTQTVNVPGAPGKDSRNPANLDDISTQVLADKSNATVGLLTVIDGPGKGETRSVFSGTNQMGRSADNRIPLDFGDNTISRTQHAVIVYDAAQKRFTILDGGKSNPIHVNGERLEAERRLKSGDTIKIGLTTLAFTTT